MFYTVYKITNEIDGKIYIGAHKTSKLDDGYMGSGKYLKNAMNKHGEENFTKEILGTFDSKDQMFNEEVHLISKLNPDYNIQPGGEGGWDHINDDKIFASNARKKGGDTTHRKYSAHQSKWGGDGQQKRQLLYPNLSADTAIRGHEEGWFGFKGKTHKKEAKRSIGAKNSIHQSGSGNSQYGSMWITNETESKKIKKTDAIPNGWHKGRKIKY